MSGERDNRIGGEGATQALYEESCGCASKEVIKMEVVYRGAAPLPVWRCHRCGAPRKLIASRPYTGAGYLH
jgi:hypothetical protein